MFELDGFANVWEHSRLLSDDNRTKAFIDLLQRHAKNNRVMEIGCGSGLLSCVAARLGATKVYAVEPTAVSVIARELVSRNGLSEIVEVLDGRLQDLEPRPVDLAFSELLNADPFFEDVVSVTNAAAPWMAAGGLLAPRNIKVYAALVRGADCAREVRQAVHSLDNFAKRFELDLSPLTGAMDTDESYRFMSQTHLPVSEPVLLYDLALGDGGEPDEELEVTTLVAEAGPVDGAMVWFECTLDDGIILHNRPGTENHWGQLICGWATERGVRSGQQVRLAVELEDNELDLAWVD
jgi:predicted O-methyltransferase YrrM